VKWYNPCAPITAAIKHATEGDGDDRGQQPFEGRPSFTKENSQLGLLVDGNKADSEQHEDDGLDDDDDDDEGAAVDDVNPASSSAAAELLGHAVAQQLKSPELKVGEKPVPMVLSFHNLRLSVPMVRGGNRKGWRGGGRFLCCECDDDDDANEDGSADCAKKNKFVKETGPAQVR